MSWAKNRFRDFQSPCKLVGTMLAASLVCLWLWDAYGAAVAPLDRSHHLSGSPELLPLLDSNQRPSGRMRPTLKDFHGSSKILENHDFHRKINVAESGRRCFYAVQGVRTLLETTLRCHQSRQLAPQVAACEGGVRKMGHVSLIVP